MDGSDEATATKEIYEFFAAQIAQDVSLDVLVARTAEVAGCAAGVVAGAVRCAAEPGAPATRDTEPPPGAVRRRLPTGETVWVARARAGRWDRALLDEFALATRVALIRHPPSRSHQQLLAIACDRGTDDHQRSVALSALGFGRNAPLRCLALAGPPAAVDRLAEVIRGRSSHAVRGLRPGGRVAIVLASDFADADTYDVPVGAHLGVSRSLPAITAPKALHESLTALRFTQPSTRDHGPYLLEEACVVTAEILGGNWVLAEHLSGADLVAVPDVQALDALVAVAGPEILRTLDVVVATESFRKAAQRLHVHHNSVAQRVARAERALGFRLADPYGRTRLFLALLIRRLRDTSALT
jgi:hypothetical protein